MRNFLKKFLNLDTEKPNTSVEDKHLWTSVEDERLWAISRDPKARREYVETMLRIEQEQMKIDQEQMRVDRAKRIGEDKRQ
jgi:hypothetical protein